VLVNDVSYDFEQTRDVPQSEITSDNGTKSRKLVDAEPPNKSANLLKRGATPAGRAKLIAHHLSPAGGFAFRSLKNCFVRVATKRKPNNEQGRGEDDQKHERDHAIR
jgi:hypothetical protein